MTVDGTEEGCRGIPQFVAGTPEPSMMRSQESPASSPIPDKQFNKNEEGKESPPIGAPRLPDLRFTTASSADVTVQHIGAAENAATSKAWLNNAMRMGDDWHFTGVFVLVNAFTDCS